MGGLVQFPCGGSVLLPPRDAALCKPLTQVTVGLKSLFSTFFCESGREHGPAPSEQWPGPESHLESLLVLKGLDRSPEDIFFYFRCNNFLK